MNANITDPVRGGDILQWAQGVTETCRRFGGVGAPNMLLRDGVGGLGYESLPANLRDRRTTDPLHPWKLFAVGKSKDVNHFFEIYIPDGSITVGAKRVEIEGITETETAKRFTFDCEADVGESATLYLVVSRDKDEESGASGTEADKRSYTSVLVVDIEEYEDDKSVRAIIPIAELAVAEGEEYDTGKVVLQIEKEAIRLDDLTVPTDKVSIDTVTAKDAPDPSAIQLKNFDNSDSDGSQGLIQRIRVVKDGKDSFHLEADGGSEVFLVARVNGKLKYIPLSGSNGKDADEGGEAPCDHPGDTPGTGKGGGVSPDDEEEHGGGNPDGGGGAAGGVPADDDTHAGEPCPDCSPKS